MQFVTSSLNIQMNSSTPSISFWNSSIELPQTYHQFRMIHRVLRKIFIPYIFSIASLGILTNTATVLLLAKSFFTKNLKNKWTLIALALSDLLFNIALLCRGIQDIIHRPPVRFCIIISFLSHLAELLSALYIVSFTIQRFTAVYYPLQAATRSRSSPLISLMAIFIFSLLFCLTISTRGSYDDCHEDLSLAWFIADAVVSFVFPFSLILIFNILIVNFIRKHSKSEISVQSILLRRQTSKKKSYLPCQNDDTMLTDNNSVNCFVTLMPADETGTIEAKFVRNSKKKPVESSQQARAPSVSSSPDRTNSDVQSTCYAMQNQNNYSTRSVSWHSTQRHSSARTSQSIRVTQTLVLVSTCFLILNAPAHICIIATKVYSNMEPPLIIDPTPFASSQNGSTNTSTIINTNSSYSNMTTSQVIMNAPVIIDHLGIHLMYITVLLAQYISYASYSINFFLYSFSGVSFRTTLRLWLRKVFKF